MSQVRRNYQDLRGKLLAKKILPVRDLRDLDTGRIIMDKEILFFEEWSALTDPGNSLWNFLNRHYVLKKTTIFPETFKVHHFVRPES